MVLSICFSTNVLARKPRVMSGGFGGFGPTVAFVNFRGLNDELGKKDIDNLNSLHWMMGGGGYAFIDRIVIGGSGWGGSQSVSSDSLRVRVNIEGGQFEAGYSLVTMRHFVATPMLGIGGSGYTVTIRHLLGDICNFGELLESPGYTSGISFSEFTLTPEIVITIPVRFIGLQLKTGYAYTPVSPEWKLADGSNLIRGPEVAEGNPFVTFNILFGGLGKGRSRN